MVICDRKGNWAFRAFLVLKIECTNLTNIQAMYIAISLASILNIRSCSHLCMPDSNIYECVKGINIFALFSISSHFINVGYCERKKVAQNCELSSGKIQQKSNIGF